MHDFTYFVSMRARLVQRHLSVMFTQQDQAMKGKIKCRQNGFQPGKLSGCRQQPYPEATNSRERIIRAESKDFDTVQQASSITGHPILSDDGAGHLSDYIALRPRKHKEFLDEYEECGEDSEHYSLYHDGKLIVFMTCIMNEHSTQSPGCTAALSWCPE